MQNEIHLGFAPYSEFFEQTVRIPFTCKYPPGVNGFATADPMDDDYPEEQEEDLGDKKEMYTMKILRKRKRLQPPREEILVSTPHDEVSKKFYPAEVYFT